MNKNIQVEAEGGELILKNKNGSIAIIPKKNRREVEDMLKEGCDDCINDFVSNLPRAHHYAKDGSLINLNE